MKVYVITHPWPSLSKTSSNKIADSSGNIEYPSAFSAKMCEKDSPSEQD